MCDEIKFYNVKEVAEILRIEEETVRVKLRKKEIKAIKIGKKWRISNHQLKKYLMEMESDENDE